MTWRETWRETVESFLREVRDPAAPATGTPAADPLVAAIAGARAEVHAIERDLEVTRGRALAEEESVGVCDRRRVQAERIGDAATARVAERFGRRHVDRLAVMLRKCDVLEDELRIARTTLNELLDLARADAPEVSRD